MTIKNQYVNCSKISEVKFRELIRYFVLGLSATKISYLSSINRNTVNRYLLEIRKKIALYCELNYPLLGNVETVPNCNSKALALSVD